MTLQSGVNLKIFLVKPKSGQVGTFSEFGLYIYIYIYI